MSIRIFRTLLTCAALAAVPSISRADLSDNDTIARPNRFSIDAQLLTRGEIRSGGLPTSEGTFEHKANFIVERTRLSLEYERKWLQTRITAQHTGVWGQSDSGSFSLYEAWAKLQAPNGLFAQVGRQELNYDDERILGRDDWAMASLSHDVLRLGYEGHGHKVHGLLAYNQKTENINGGTDFRTGDGVQPYKTMQMLWYHYDIPRADLGLSLLFMNIGLQSNIVTDSRTRFQQLFGTYISYRPASFQLEGALYWQRGHDEFNIPISAFMGSLRATYRPHASVRLTGGYDYLSGDDNPVVPQEGMIGLVRHKKVKGFNPIYGSHHQFYGAMDFFYIKAYYAGYTPGLQNIYLSTTYSPVKGLDINAQYHYLSVASKISEARKTLGHELDLSAQYAFLKFCAVSLGYTYMHGSSTLARLRRTTAQNNLRWAWLMISINPRIFTTKW